jgi:hypothetical protein
MRNLPAKTKPAFDFSTLDPAAVALAAIFLIVGVGSIIGIVWVNVSDAKDPDTRVYHIQSSWAKVDAARATIREKRSRAYLNGDLATYQQLEAEEKMLTEKSEAAWKMLIEAKEAAKGAKQSPSK